MCSYERNSRTVIAHWGSVNDCYRELYNLSGYDWYWKFIQRREKRRSVFQHPFPSPATLSSVWLITKGNNNIPSDNQGTQQINYTIHRCVQRLSSRLEASVSLCIFQAEGKVVLAVVNRSREVTGACMYVCIQRKGSLLPKIKVWLYILNTR